MFFLGGVGGAILNERTRIRKIMEIVHKERRRERVRKEGES